MTATVAVAPGRHRYFSGWTLTAALIAGLVMVPIAVVLASLLTPASEVWDHLATHVLPGLLINTVWLVCGVVIGVTLLGVTLAWLTAVYEFPGRRFFSWALLLPLAVPAYVSAFVFVGLLDFTGVVQTTWRAWFGPTTFPAVRSRGGVILVMTLAFYPYVYLIARNAFVTQGRRVMEVAQSLGLSRRAAFYRVAIPLARPWIIGGVMLVIMETLADFGTVTIFNYDTLTTGIYKAWYGLFSLTAASQIASLLVILVLGLILIEQYTRFQKRYAVSGRSAATPARLPLTGIRRVLATSYCGAVFAVAFLIPLLQLLTWSAQTYREDLDARYFEFLWHTLMLGGLAALLTAITALALSYAARYSTHTGMTVLTRIATLGYALPGPVLAVGTYIPLAWLDNLFADTLRATLGIESTQLLAGSLLTMLIAYGVRFLAVAFHPLDGNMQRITRSVDEAARTLGAGGVKMLARVHVPILRGGLLTAMILVFVDVLKEMPITLMTRPFGWDTLAIRLFELTSEGQWERAALPAVALVVVGLVPIIYLTRYTEHK